MKRIIIAFIIFILTSKIQSQIALDSLLVEYYNLAATSKDSNLYKEKFFEVFPDNFQLFDSIYGYKDIDSIYLSPLYFVSYEHVDKFYATIDVVDRILYYKKIINISQNGHWASDAISCFQFNLHELLLNNTEQFLEILESYTNIEIKSFWHFFYVNNIFDHPYNIERHKKVSEKIKALNYTRILTLMEEQYQCDYKEYLDNVSK